MYDTFSFSLDNIIMQGLTNEWKKTRNLYNDGTYGNTIIKFQTMRNLFKKKTLNFFANLQLQKIAQSNF